MEDQATIFVLISIGIYRYYVERCVPCAMRWMVVAHGGRQSLLGGDLQIIFHVWLPAIDCYNELVICLLEGKYLSSSVIKSSLCFGGALWSLSAKLRFKIISMACGHPMTWGWESFGWMVQLDCHWSAEVMIWELAGDQWLRFEQSLQHLITNGNEIFFPILDSCDIETGAWNW